MEDAPLETWLPSMYSGDAGLAPACSTARCQESRCYKFLDLNHRIPSLAETKRRHPSRQSGGVPGRVPAGGGGTRYMVNK